MEKKVQGDGLGQKGQVKSHKGENKCFLSSRKPQYRKLVEEHFFLSLENFIWIESINIYEGKNGYIIFP